jgi:O-antigen/teichoic acid export membrane protein
VSDAAVTAIPPVLTPGGPAPASVAAPAAKPTGGTVLRGLVWLGGVRWAAQLFTWASTLIIARLLAPEDYGLVAMATVLTGFLEVVTDLGLGSALVQSRDLSRREIEATMGATCLLGVGATVIVAASAPIWARVQGDPRIMPIMLALAFGVLLTVIANVPYSMLHRRLAFGLVARAQFVRGLLTAAATVAGAFVLQSHWALVGGYLVGKLAFTIMLMTAEPVRPRMPGPDTSVGRFLRFGGILTADRVLNYARSNIDVALVGALLGSRMVGLYVMATALARMPLEKLGSAFEPVAYPTFARLRDDVVELRRFFLGLSLGTMAIALPAACGLILTAGLLVPTVIGGQWMAVVRPLQIAAVVTPLAFHLGIVSALFNAMGRVDLNLRVTTLTSVLTIAGVFVGVRFGIVGVATASGVAFAAVWCYAELLMLRMTGLRWHEVARALLPALSSSLGMSACVFLAMRVMPASWPGVVRLGMACGVGVLTFVAWALLLHRGSVVPQLRSLKAAWRAR